ncbi:hypothetical protein BDV96DRAFT_596246 [Lophiotrema nucula]|uniref:Six-hairpin glycosidase-like protein n=1 Tax=Lophiotrema nucula TaxID=690887 RepID=A0A6A5ZK61_9PLEO|nr:hypothetical protein BDV96DRAFT_596246 [Lophiotrema nucula]
MLPRLAAMWHLSRIVALLLWVLAVATSTSEDADAASLIDRDTNHSHEQQHILHPIPSPPASQQPSKPDVSSSMIANALQDLHTALSTMQDEYFSLWLGKWTTAIDWTAAVMGTHLSSTLSSLSHSLSYTMPGTFDKSVKLDVEAQMIENEINKYFSQSITYFFGEDVFGIRNQAFDDMLWVVLGWLEGIRFIESHSERHYPLTEGKRKEEAEWHARQFIPTFAHRSRIFYELAERGWDWEVCGGGMTWNPHLLPYKNAITNELFISASIGMYLYFPGDDNCSPFVNAADSSKHPKRDELRAAEHACEDRTSHSTYDPKYLAEAINGYNWLKNSGMTNAQGLYTDGFHIHDYGKNGTIGTGKCDERNEMVYTYNQGVILSGLRQLWEATGNLTYLEDGHELVRNVIRATGWTDTDIPHFVSFEVPEHLAKEKRDATKQKPKPNSLPQNWSGLGSAGILSELCDSAGTCSQDAQTFKGIFFHHLTTFCTPLPRYPVAPGQTYGASKEIAALHRRSCNEYAPWVIHNAQAALRTRDSKGRFGAWWGAGIDSSKSLNDHEGTGEWTEKHVPKPQLPPRAMDYRNMPSYEDEYREFRGERLVEEQNGAVRVHGDVNDRGRGRTVETQGGGVAVVKAMWEFLRRFEEDVG